MSLNFRAIFDRYNIPWQDRGSNCSAGNINVPCPFCGTDPSFHMSISEDSGAYYCFRNSRHSGGNLVKVLTALKVPAKEFQNFKPSSSYSVQQSEERNRQRDYSEWQYFTPAEQSPEALQYLSGRLFDYPVEACKKFKFRVAANGQWAGRLIIPLSVGWTGRSMRDHIQPRYLAETDKAGFYFFSNNSKSLVIQEGALDSMRLASVSKGFDVAGMCGNKLSPALLALIREKKYLSTYFLPDSTVPFLQAHQDFLLLRSYCTFCEVKKIKHPPGSKDLGEMTEESVRLWIHSKESQFWKTGLELGALGRENSAQKTNGA